MHAFLVFIALTSANPDRLEIRTEMGIGAFSAAQRRWFTPEMYRDAEMFCASSFQPEVVVFILRPDKFAKKKGDTVVVVREAVTPMSTAFADLLPKKTFKTENNDVDWAGIAEAELTAAAKVQIKVKESRAPIDEETARAVEALWDAALIEARYPDLDPATIGFDGESCSFSDIVLGAGELRGSTWSPTGGSRMHDLVTAGRKLIAYGRSTDTERASALSALMQSVNRAMKRFAPIQ